ncbi:hypothetical protein P153DRAFT_296995 [Dothidotthia symphoricarpi CBS 119687]|uniref:DUF7730 domain-containing protein n=1 Tax=Dothidotthia symphoricarpi CBS 119687 TaxID=1392245 RepID=A0A6A6A6X4_9PLEO|nr:uncharacterized protein P153DRAFT_296995 [Dothidotthia symphoricarpi CBS 119687]KAF2126955.1 hypothetical protein P153DRAFT_296995 [Dothidotthia symphoricarpi CBS 119687]
MKARLINLIPGVRWVPHDLPAQDSSSQKSKPRKRFSLRSSPHPSPLGAVHNRKSTLSLRSEPDEVVDARTLAQGQSIFFAMLPLEIRREVYEYVMGAESVHLTLGAKKRLGHFVCEEGGDGGGRECTCRVLGGGKGNGRLSRGGLSIAMACRRMYSEAVPYLYRSHAFSLLHMSHLLHLPTAVPQPRLNQIRTLRLRWTIRALPYLRRGPADRVAYREDTAMWERGWAIIASMQGLRDLYVVVVDPSPQDMWESSWVELEEQLLQPVRSVTKPKCFELMLPYASCGVEWEMGSSRVVLRRPDGQEGLEDEV